MTSVPSVPSVPPGPFGPPGPSGPPAAAVAEELRRLQQLLPAELGPGLSERELDEVEARFGFRFAADHRVFLAAGLPYGSPSWPDWRHGDPAELRAWLARPVEGVLFDVEHNGFWHPNWGPEPAGRPEALRIAAAELADVPQLVPVYGHRYLPGTAGEFGHPVLSVHQTDAVYYGNDLADYLRYEFTGRSAGLSRARATVGFWSYLLEGCPETAVSTPHDPYATTPAEAVEHLRMLALERLIGRRVADEQLVQAGLVALVLDVESPSLPLLAGLPRAEHGRAGALFGQVLTELGLDSGLPQEAARWESAHWDAAGWEPVRWELVRWWLRLIVNGSTAPAAGVEVIAHEGWGALARPEALRPLVELAGDREQGRDGGRETVADAIRAEADRLLAGPWPPPRG
ncbi:hypothetical protein ABTZ03_41515 [Kitasatospora sp. NPDC096077]|uniref:hypothetical protein n=1 Tax=Kitasatospora sp. NPDC096077 TaxID=3155544 RepID=UPI003332F4B5